MTRKRKRIAEVKRVTSETNVWIKLNLDGCGRSLIDTGIPFLNHMLTSLSKHGLFDCRIRAKGDLEVDPHHTNEDVGIVLGQAFAKALGNKAGIRRFGFFQIPMDEALTKVTLDISGRPSFHVIKSKKVQLHRSIRYSFHDACEFLRAFTQHAGINAIVEIIAGDDSHHVIESVFKSFAKALDTATQMDPRIKGIPSTKGRL